MLLALLVVLLILALMGGGLGHSSGWGYLGWSPFGLIVLVILILILTGHGFAAELGPIPVGAALVLGSVQAPAIEQDDTAGPPGLPYAISYWIGVAIMVYLAGDGFVVTQYVGGHGADLPFNFGTPQGFAALQLVTVLISAFGRVVPNVQHTPAFRQREILHARRGIVPRDLKRLVAGGEPPPAHNPRT